MTTKYKILTKGDIIREGDEFDAFGSWVPSRRVGGKVIHGDYRRPIVAETQQYRILTKEDILQEGDEFNSCLDGWVPSRNVGRKSLSDSSYRRPIPAEKKQYRDVNLGEVLQEGDECLTYKGGWEPLGSTEIGAALYNPGFKVRRPIPIETKQEDYGSITEAQREIIDSERDKRNSAVIENEALKTRLENALSDKVVAQAKNDELYRKLVERDNYIINLTARLMDKEAVARRLTDRVINVTNDLASHEEFLRQVAQALGMGVYRISFQDVLERVRSMTSRNASLDRQLKDALAYKSIAKAELDKVRDAVKNLAKWL